eukprot:COSAG02_NODE_59644_length_273_cov_1.488506_1_plen_23_part_01
MPDLTFPMTVDRVDTSTHTEVQA